MGATARPSRDPDGITTMLSTFDHPPTNTITATTVTELSSTSSERRSVFERPGDGRGGAHLAAQGGRNGTLETTEIERRHADL